MIKLLKKIYIFPQLIKRIIKKKKFDENSLYGENLTVSAGSNCLSKDKQNIVIGDNCDICGILSANGNGKISIGNYTTIRGDSIVGSINNIKIGNYVIISNNVHIYDNNNHPIEPNLRKELCESGFYSEKWSWQYSKNEPITIEDKVWIGERSTILKGVIIGTGSIVASNSVVTNDVPPYVIVAGNPAKIVKKI